MDNKLVVRKDNWLIRETVNKFTKGQNRLMCLLLGKFVNLNDEFCLDTSISVDEFRQALGLSDGEKNYYRLRKEVMRFGENGSVGLPRIDEKGEITYTWLPYFTKIDLSKNRVEFEWNPHMKPHLINLKENYTQYLASDYLKLKSIYSQNLYEQLKSVQNYEKQYHQEPSFAVDDLRKFMRIDGKKAYQRWGAFKQLVLDKAIQEINEVTDLFITMKTHKDGRYVKTCSFHIQTKNDRFDYNGCFLSQNEIGDIIYKYQAKNKIYDLARIKQTQPEKYKKLRHGGKSDYDIIINFINRDNIVQEQDITDYEEQTAYDGTTIEQGMFPF